MSCIRVATEHRADAMHRETSLAFTAGSEKGVTRLLKEASCLATKLLLSGWLSSLAVAAAEDWKHFKRDNAKQKNSAFARRRVSADRKSEGLQACEICRIAVRSENLQSSLT